MALNTSNCNHLTPLRFRGLTSLTNFQFHGHSATYIVCVCVVQLNGNIQSNELRGQNLTVRLRDGSVIRMILNKPSTLADLKAIHNVLLVAKTSAESCKYFSLWLDIIQFMRKANSQQMSTGFRADPGFLAVSPQVT